MPCPLQLFGHSAATCATRTEAANKKVAVRILKKIFVEENSLARGEQMFSLKIVDADFRDGLTTIETTERIGCDTMAFRFVSSSMYGV